MALWLDLTFDGSVIYVDFFGFLPGVIFFLDHFLVKEFGHRRKKTEKMRKKVDLQCCKC